MFDGVEMMGDLISRSALIEALKKEEKECEDCMIMPNWYSALKILDEQQTADAVPVVHAEWIDIQPDYHSGFYGNVHKCSNCNDYYTTEYYDLFFCPRCGAKMDGKKVQE